MSEGSYRRWPERIRASINSNELLWFVGFPTDPDCIAILAADDCTHIFIPPGWHPFCAARACQNSHSGVTIIHHLATTNSLQGTLAEMLGIALADLRLRNDAFRKGHANGVIASRSEAEG
jgi:hypothetical protein